VLAYPPITITWAWKNSNYANTEKLALSAGMFEYLTEVHSEKKMLPQVKLRPIA